MREGSLAQWDTPYNLHHHPADAGVADFIRREALAEQRAAAYARGR
jgi:iron(III) transport system ATP-binding protein